jgi:hypothetical protein
MYTHKRRLSLTHKRLIMVANAPQRARRVPFPASAVGACALLMSVVLLLVLGCLAPAVRAADDDAAAFDSPWVVNLTDKNFDDFVTNSSSWVLECVAIDFCVHLFYASFLSTVAPNPINALWTRVWRSLRIAPLATRTGSTRRGAATARRSPRAMPPPPRQRAAKASRSARWTARRTAVSSSALASGYVAPRECLGAAAVLV